VRSARAFAPLRHRPFRLLAIGQLTSNIGDLFYTVALPWYVLSHHGDALLLGAVLACYGVARTGALMVGGALSDRLRPWTVMMAADTGRAVVMAALVVVVATQRPSLVFLAPIAVLLGLGGGLFMPGSMAIIPALLPDEDLQAGNALSSGWTQLAVLVGPAIGGVVVAAVGPAPAFAVDGATYVISALTLVGVRVLRPVAGAHAPSAGAAAPGDPAAANPGDPAVAEADESAVAEPADPTVPVPPADDRKEPTLWQVVRAERVLRLIFAITLVANLTSGGLSEVALPSLAHGPLHAGSAGYGALVASIGAGALIGTILAGQAPSFRRPAVVGSCGFIAQCVFEALVPYLGGTVPAGVMLACFGLLNGFSNVLTITAFQRWARPQMLGRLMGFLMLGSLGIFPVSVLLGGAIVHSFGPAVFFPLSGVLVAATVALSLVFRDWREFGATVTEAPEPISVGGT
jgi:predicted MFS family arabinose efflux permease